MEDMMGNELEVGDKIIHFGNPRYVHWVTPCVITGFHKQGPTTDKHERPVGAHKTLKYDWED